MSNTQKKEDLYPSSGILGYLFFEFSGHYASNTWNNKLRRSINSFVLDYEKSIVESKLFTSEFNKNFHLVSDKHKRRNKRNRAKIVLCQVLSVNKLYSKIKEYRHVSNLCSDLEHNLYHSSLGELDVKNPGVICLAEDKRFGICLPMNKEVYDYFIVNKNTLRKRGTKAQRQRRYKNNHKPASSHKGECRPACERNWI